MVSLGKLAFALAFALGVTAMLVLPSSCHRESNPEPALPPSPRTESHAADPTPSPQLVNTQDRNTPSTVNPSSTRAVASDARKPLSMAEAVMAAERLGKGTVVKAERRDKPVVHYKFEVLGRDGQKRQLELNTDGSLRNEK